MKHKVEKSALRKLAQFAIEATDYKKFNVVAEIGTHPDLRVFVKIKKRGEVHLEGLMFFYHAGDTDFTESLCDEWIRQANKRIEQFKSSSKGKKP